MFLDSEGSYEEIILLHIGRHSCEAGGGHLYIVSQPGTSGLGWQQQQGGGDDQDTSTHL